MKYGLFGFHRGDDLTALARLARQTEEAGYESIWVGEHVVMPHPDIQKTPMAPDEPRLDPIVALTWVAAHTQRVKLGTGVIVLPHRQPLILSRQIASLDLLSNGRLIFGIGVGWLQPEIEAVGGSYVERGAQSDEYLAAMETIWSGEYCSFKGKWVSWDRMIAVPPPAQLPRPPITVGGHTKPAYRRALTKAEGWYGFGLDVEATARCLEGLRETAQEVDRPASLGDLEITITPPAGPLDRDTAKRYEDLGVHRLAVLRPQGGSAVTERFIWDFADGLIR
ncbi:MAG: TIGR03619 family F420-dependent LLM class oxidoreductase [Chloroflexota bacterium]